MQQRPERVDRGSGDGYSEAQGEGTSTLVDVRGGTTTILSHGGHGDGKEAPRGTTGRLSEGVPLRIPPLQADVDLDEPHPGRVDTAGVQEREVRTLSRMQHQCPAHGTHDEARRERSQAARGHLNDAGVLPAREVEQNGTGVGGDTGICGPEEMAAGTVGPHVERAHETGQTGPRGRALCFRLGLV